jgi:hypothetical protein
MSRVPVRQAGEPSRLTRRTDGAATSNRIAGAWGACLAGQRAIALPEPVTARTGVTASPVNLGSYASLTNGPIGTHGGERGDCNLHQKATTKPYRNRSTPYRNFVILKVTEQGISR